MRRVLRPAALISPPVLLLPLHSVHELFLLALLAGGITLVRGVVWELAEFLTDAVATLFSYLRRVLHIERRRNIERRAS